jgi:ribosomal protein S18 acetylase RimI-like enzyme
MSLAKEIWMMRDFAAICGWSRLIHLQSATRPLIAAHPREPHHYLFVLGVDPSAQGRGLGRQLITPILEVCDRDHLPAYLETATERNLGFYQSLGFAITGEHQVTGGPLVWFMWRPARS